MYADLYAPELTDKALESIECVAKARDELCEAISILPDGFGTPPGTRDLMHRIEKDLRRAAKELSTFLPE